MLCLTQRLPCFRNTALITRSVMATFLRRVFIITSREVCVWRRDQTWACKMRILTYEPITGEAIWEDQKIDKTAPLPEF